MLADYSSSPGPRARPDYAADYAALSAAAAIAAAGVDYGAADALGDSDRARIRTEADRIAERLLKTEADLERLRRQGDLIGESLRLDRPMVSWEAARGRAAARACKAQERSARRQQVAR